MTIKLEIKNINEFKPFRQKLRTVRLQLLGFQAETIRTLSRDLVLKRIWKKMSEAGFSEKIIRGTIISDIAFLSRTKVRIFFKSEFFSETGFDVALAREKGTKTHDVEGHPLAIPIDGEVIFRTKARPSGIVALKIIETTLDEMKEPVQDEYNRRRNMWLKQNFGGNTFGL